LGIPVPTGKKKGKLDVQLHWQKINAPNNLSNDDDNSSNDDEDGEDSVSSNYYTDDISKLYN
jgi:hypothetical protein